MSEDRRSRLSAREPSGLSQARREAAMVGLLRPVRQRGRPARVRPRCRRRHAAARRDSTARDHKKSKVFTYEVPGAKSQARQPATAWRTRAPRRVPVRSCGSTMESGLLELKTTATSRKLRLLRELIPTRPIGSKEQRAALARIARSFLAGRAGGRVSALPTTCSPGERLVCAICHPERSRGTFSRRHSTPQASPQRVAALDRSYLFIQGPPGSGKSTYGSQVICDLLETGKRVAVTSTSHAAIHNLLHKVEARSARRGQRFEGLYKHSTMNPKFGVLLQALGADDRLHQRYESAFRDACLCSRGRNELSLRARRAGRQVRLSLHRRGRAGRARRRAGGFALRATMSYLLGDPSQLAQVSQGRHLPHGDDSVLGHLLGDAPTVAPERGIFLELTYRMQPEICAFISDAMYEGRLHSTASAREHRVTLGTRSFEGLYFAPVEHTGNSSSSIEEADEIVRQVARLYPYERSIIVVTPYNAQRRLIARKLGEAGFELPVGTVDKFQGQEAAVVFYSMATSSGDRYAAQPGVSVRTQSLQRCDLTGARRERSGLQPPSPRHLVPLARRDGPRESSLRVR